MIIKKKNINKKVTPNKPKHAEAEKKNTDLTKKVVQISEKKYDFLLDRMYFTGDDGHLNFLVFILNSLTLYSNKKVTEYRPEYHLKKINHLMLTLNRSNLPNGRVI